MRNLFVHFLLQSMMLLSSPALALQHGSSQPPIDESTRFQQLLVRGMTQSFLGNTDKAIAIYERALLLSPTSSTVNSSLSEAYEKLEQYDQAIYYARLARDSDPDRIYYHKQLATLFVKTQDIDNAEQVLKNTLSIFPENVEVLEDLARLQYSNNRLDDALANYRLLETRLGSQQRITYRLLQIYTKMQDAEGVEKTLLKLDGMVANSTAIKRDLSELYEKSGRPTDAIRILEDALRIDSTDVATIAPLARLYETAGEPERAKSLWGNALDNRQAPEDLVEQATQLYTQQGHNANQSDVVVSLLERALEENPNLEAGLILLGNIRFEEKNYEEAGDLLYRAVQLNPRNQDVWLQAAAAYLRLKKPARAAEIADEALLLFPGQLPLLRVAAYGYMDAYNNRNAIARFNEFYALIQDKEGHQQEIRDILPALGLLYSRTQNDAMADSIYSLALNNFPDHPVVLNNYAFLLAERSEKLENALEYAQKAVELDASNASYMDTLGWVYYKMERLKDAETWIQRAIATGKASAATYEHLGDIQVRQGRSKEAIASWNKSLELNPKNQQLIQKLNNNED